MSHSTERLSHVEEIELVRLYQQFQDKYFLDKIVTRNLGLVHKVVNKFPIKNASVSYDDLFQEGVAGLIHGIKKFDVKKGCRLSTYVFNWITAYVRRYYANHGRTVRLPVHVTDAQLKLNKQVETLTHRLGRTPTLDEISSVNADAVAIMNDVKSGVSLNAKIGDDSELEDVCADDNTENFECVIDVDILLSRLSETVSARDLDILRRRFGLDRYAPHTLSEVGDVYELTRARVHQIEHKLINKLKQIAYATS